jgi:hypothetical protein
MPKLPSIAQMAAELALKSKPRNIVKGAERQSNLDRFLENSKVKEPMYHGTKSDIYEFNPKAKAVTQGGQKIKKTGAMFFTDNPHLANQYTGTAKSPMFHASPETGGHYAYPRNSNEGGNVMPVYLNMENPYVIDANGQMYHQIEDQIAKAKKLGHDSVILNNVYDSPGASGSLESIGHNAHIVFDPKQIKSAIGNQGTFNPSEPDITKANGGVVHMMKGGDPIKMALEEALKRSPVKVPSVKPQQVGNYNALPLRRRDLTARAASRSDKEIAEIAQRIADQQMGLHVTSGVQGDTKNRAGRSIRENERIKQTQYNLKPIGTVAEPVPFEPKKGMVIVGTTGDQTISDFNLVDVNGLPINSDQTGGGKYAMGQRHLADPKGWNSGVDPANMYQNKITDLALIEGVDPEQIYGIHMGMGRQSNNFAQHFADANLKSIYSHLLNRGDYTPEDIGKLKENSGIQDLNKIIKNGFYDSQKQKQVEFKDFPGVENYEQAYQFMLDNPEARKWFNNRMKVPKLTAELGLPNGLDTEWAISEPALRNMEIGMSGLGTFRATPFRKPVPDPSYEMYGHYFPGVGIGPSEVLMPYEIAYPDAHAHIMATQPSSSFSGTIQKVFPHQFVDDEYLRQYQSYKDALDKAIKTGSYKDGGLAKGGTPPESSVTIEGVRYEPEETYTDPMGMAVPSSQMTSQDEMRFALAKKNMSPMPLSEPYRDPVTGAILERGLEALPPGSNPTEVGGMTPIDFDNLPEEEKERTIADRIAGALETGTTLGTGALAFPYAFGKGLMSGDFNKTFEDTMANNLYIPRDKGGIENLEILGKGLEASKLPPLIPEIQGIEPIISAATKRGVQLGAKGVKEGIKKGIGAPVGMSIKDVSPSVTIEPLSPKDEFGFYSKLEKESQKIQRKQGNGQAFMNDLLKLGAKPHELEDTGMAEFLKNNKTLTKEDVVGFAQRNRPEMKQTTLGKDARFNVESSRGSADQLYYDYIYKDDGSTPNLFNSYNVTSDGNLLGHLFETDEARPQYYVYSELADVMEGPFSSKSRAEEYLKDALEMEDINLNPKHEQHFRTQGGENYREVLVQIPQKDVTQGQILDDMARRLGAKNFESLPMEQRHELARLAKGTPFTKGHYEEFPNTMINMRMDDRVDVEGKKGTLLDELQSDWHQKGKEEGYKQKLSDEDKKRIAQIVNTPNWNTDEKMVADFQRLNAKAKAFERGVPDAPYKKNWYELGLKKAIQQSVERGDDRLYMSMGKTVADRYDLSKQISELHYSGTNLVAYDHNGNQVIKQTGISKEQLPEYIGKEATKKLLEQEPKGTLRSLTGLDLQVGGEGMDEWYDKKYLSYLNKFAKKYGGHVGETEIPTPHKGMYSGRDIMAHYGISDAQWKDMADNNELDALRKKYEDYRKNATTKVYYYEPSPEAKKKIMGGLPYKKGGVVRMDDGGIMKSPQPNTVPSSFPPITGAEEEKIKQQLFNLQALNLSEPAYMEGVKEIKTNVPYPMASLPSYAENSSASAFVNRENPSVVNTTNTFQGSILNTPHVLGHEAQHTQETLRPQYPMNAYEKFKQERLQKNIESNFQKARDKYPEFRQSGYYDQNNVPFFERLADFAGNEASLPKGQRLVDTPYGKEIFNTPELQNYYHASVRPTEKKMMPQTPSMMERNPVIAMAQQLKDLSKPKLEEFRARLATGDSYADALYKTIAGAKFADGGSVAEREIARMKEITEKAMIRRELAGGERVLNEYNSSKPTAEIKPIQPVNEQLVNQEYSARRMKPTVALEPIGKGGSRIPSTQLELFKKKGGNVSIDDMRLALIRKI